MRWFWWMLLAAAVLLTIQVAVTGNVLWFKSPHIVPKMPYGLYK